MKKLFLGIILFAAIVMPTFANSTISAENVLLYQSETKNPWIAVGASWFIPTLGHAYAGDWQRGLPFLAADVACIVAIGSGISNTIQNGDSSLVTIGYLGFVVSRIWEYIDSYNTAEDFNKALKQKYGMSLSYNFDANQNAHKLGFKVPLTF